MIRVPLSLSLILLLIHGLAAAPSEGNVRSSPRFIQDWLPARLFSGFVSWLSGNEVDSDIERYHAKNDVIADPTKSTLLTFRIFNPIRSLVVQAGSALAGVRNRISNSMTSFSDYVVNGLTYATETTKLPQYAHGEDIPEAQEGEFDNRKYSHGTSGSAERRKLKMGQPEAEYEGFLRTKRFPPYDTYYSLRSAPPQHIQDYEDYLQREEEEEKANEVEEEVRKGDEDPLQILNLLYRKLEKAFGDR